MHSQLIGLAEAERQQCHAHIHAIAHLAEVSSPEKRGGECVWIMCVLWEGARARAGWEGWGGVYLGSESTSTAISFTFVEWLSACVWGGE